jgi:hypothetical protein
MSEYSPTDGSFDVPKGGPRRAAPTKEGNAQLAAFRAWLDESAIPSDHRLCNNHALELIYKAVLKVCIG